MPDGKYALGASTVSLSEGVCRDSVGRLAGPEADIVLLDRTLTVMRTYVGGRTVFDKLHQD